MDLWMPNEIYNLLTHLTWTDVLSWLCNQLAQIQKIE